MHSAPWYHRGVDSEPVRGEAVRGHLEALLLAAIASGATHGYAITEWLRSRSDNLFDLPDGTIYPALRRLQERGWLTSRWEATGERRRKVYSLTPRGELALADSRRDWARFQRGVTAILGEA